MTQEDMYIQGKVRATVMNWENFLQSVIDGYNQQRSLVHGVQKDAIQNGWDARKDRKNAHGFEFIFRLVEGPEHNYLEMSDKGTTGLTGRVLSETELMKDLPDDEKWGRFESLAFSKQIDADKTPLGSRGRGKFVFVGASKTRRILYDSYREDDTYRFGWRKVVLTQSPISAYDGDVGRAKLREMTDNTFEPLESPGSRVIIEDPIDDLVASIRSGEFGWMIGETWWQILQDYDIRIVVEYDGQIHNVSIPDEFDLISESEGDKKAKIEGPMKIEFGKTKATVKKLHIVCEPGVEVPEHMRGIAVQRGGMKITNIMPEVLPARFTYAMYGYVILDKRGEEELRKAEGLEHNTLSYRHSFTRGLRVWLRDKMKEFAVEELGYDIHPLDERLEEQRTAERRALSVINKMANKLKLGVEVKPPRPSRKRPKREDKPLRIEFPTPRFPKDSSRVVEYGEVIEGIGATLINHREQTVEARFRVSVETEHGMTLDVLLDDDLVLWDCSSLQRASEMTVAVDKFRFPRPGKYQLRAELSGLDPVNGMPKVFDVSRYVFYIEEEPTVQGIFEGYEPIGDLPDEYSRIIGTESRGPAGGIIMRYNVDHPAYKAAQDTDRITEYLFRLAVLIMAKHDLSSDEPRLFELDKDSEIDPIEILDQYGDIIGNMLYLYHKGKK